MAEADRGRHPGFRSFKVLSGGPGSLALAFHGDSSVFSNASWHSRITNAFSEIGSPRRCTLARLGASDLRAQTQIPSVLRTDTPPPAHRLQQLLEALSRPGQVQTCYTMFVSERLSPSTRDRVRQPVPRGPVRSLRRTATAGGTRHRARRVRRVLLGADGLTQDGRPCHARRNGFGPNPASVFYSGVTR
jgi:hypothetical protein